MKFTKKTDYALRTMELLARTHSKLAGSSAKSALPISVQTISEQTHLSLRFLQGIVSRLSKAKLLKTAPGVNGGISLAKVPESISILEIIEAVEGKINLMQCLSHHESCSDFQQCSVMGVLQTAQAALVSSLANSNLKLMVNTIHDPFNRLPKKHFIQPQFGCPVLK